MKKRNIKNFISHTCQFLINHVFIGSWWVIAFMILCFFLFEKSLEKRAELHHQLTQQYLSLQNEKESVLNQQKNLERQIQSQSDPLWIELILIKKLGLVPEGQKKIFFYPMDDL